MSTETDVKAAQKKKSESKTKGVRAAARDYATVGLTAHEFRSLVRWFPVAAFPEGRPTSFVYFKTDSAISVPLIQSLGSNRSSGLRCFEIGPPASDDVIRSTLAKAEAHASNTAVLINPEWTSVTVEGRDVNSVLKDVFANGLNLRTLIVFSKPLDERAQTETERLIQSSVHIKAHERQSRRLQSLWMDFFFFTVAR